MTQSIQTALITGASYGIGAAFAEALAAQGINLVLVARSHDKLQALAEQLQQQFQVQVKVCAQDLTATGAIDRVWQFTQNQNWPIDLLINNAGFGDYGEFSDRPLEKQLQMIQLNVSALVGLTHCFLPGMRERRRGGIINVASIAAFQPLPYLSIYAATKAFVLSFSEALWAENRDRGVEILCVCPGPTETEFFKTAEFPSQMMHSRQSPPLTSPQEVVQKALAAFEKQRSNVVIARFLGHIIVNLPRWLPRETLVKFLKGQFQPPAEGSNP